MPVLIKKIIIALRISRMSMQEKRDFARESAVQVTAHAVSYPGITGPTAAGMITLCDAGDLLAEQRATMANDLKTLTDLEQANLVTIMKGVDAWQLIVQGLAGLTVALVTQLGWFVKTEGTDNRVEMLNSSPIVNKANQATTKKIALELINSFTNKKAKPYGAKGWIPFVQIGGTKPTSHDSMTAEIPTGKMKYSKTFAAGDLGKQFYVTFVWFDGTEFIGPDSPIYSFTII